MIDKGRFVFSKQIKYIFSNEIFPYWKCLLIKSVVIVRNVIAISIESYALSLTAVNCINHGEREQKTSGGFTRLVNT